MIDQDMSVPVLRLSLFFLALIATGGLLALSLYEFNLYKFKSSTLFTKIIMWFPIYLIFVGVLYSGTYIRIAFFGFIIIYSLKEVINTSGKKFLKLGLFYWYIFVIALLHIPIFRLAFPDPAATIISVAFASVISDVTAFFSGKFSGSHKLPEYFNKKKSYEGVFGQLLGAFAGLLLIKIFLVDVLPLWFFIPIGFGSLVGDLSNSYVKRRIHTKDWGSGIPGHGGYIDRLSSLAGAFLLSYYLLFAYAL